jgi:uncharacterized protein (DUF3084 family)
MKPSIKQRVVVVAKALQKLADGEAKAKDIRPEIKTLVSKINQTKDALTEAKSQVKALEDVLASSVSRLKVLHDLNNRMNRVPKPLAPSEGV